MPQPAGSCPASGTYNTIGTPTGLHSPAPPDLFLGHMWPFFKTSVLSFILQLYTVDVQYFLHAQYPENSIANLAPLSQLYTPLQVTCTTTPCLALDVFWNLGKSLHDTLTLNIVLGA